MNKEQFKVVIYEVPYKPSTNAADIPIILFFIFFIQVDTKMGLI
jgi:hypothetical protein